MRRLACVVFLAIPLSFIGHTPASAQTDDDGYNWAPYAAVSIGGIWPTLEFNNTLDSPMYFGVEVAGAVGLEMPWLRWDVIDVAYDWGNSKIGAPMQGLGVVNGSTSLTSLGTGFRVGPFRKGLPVYPYASLGFAGGRIETDGIGVFSSFSDWGFQWNAGLGVEARVLDRLRAGLRFRYRSTFIEFTPYNGLGVYAVQLDLYSLNLEVVY
jgi:opacity protein-like surface antigen